MLMHATMLATIALVCFAPCTRATTRLDQPEVHAHSELAHNPQLQQKRHAQESAVRIQIMYGKQPEDARWAMFAFRGTELTYMYEPVLSTLLEGFSAMQNHVLPVTDFGTRFSSLHCVHTRSNGTRIALSASAPPLRELVALVCTSSHFVF